MNVCDSEIISSIMKSGGFTDVDEFNGHEKPDVLILNCCSVREDGHIAAIDMAKRVKDRWKDVYVIICGCYSILLSHSIFEQYPFIDAIVKPKAYRLFPMAIHSLKSGDIHFVKTDDTADDLYEEIRPSELSLPNKAVVVAKGCNQNCAYCIEPYTRGNERFISPQTIMENVKEMLVRQESGEVTLVGHLIDRYHYSEVDFPKLLKQVATLCSANGTLVKYISSHPSTYSDKIVETVLEHENVMRVVHLPVQSGSDAVLGRMHRGYSAGEFVRRVESIRRLCPEMKIVTDIMVGFCGETAADFQASVDLLKEVLPADINIYKFSMRSHTFASSYYTDDVTEAVKEERYQAMLELRKTICTES